MDGQSASVGFVTLLVSVGGLLAFGALFTLWYLRLCRKFWLEFKQGVLDAGGWNGKSRRELLDTRTCPMCGAVAKTACGQCPACGEKLPIDLSAVRLPTGVLVIGIVVAILLPILVVALVVTFL